MAENPFDAKARTWDAEPEKHERARRVAELIRRELGDGLARMRVLEYGSGTGLLGFALQPHVAHLTLMDSSGEMLAVAREKLAASGAANVELAQRDLTEGPLPQERWDAICSLLTLHHVPDTDGLLRRLHALLAPGGALCLSDLDAEDGSFHGHGADVHHGFDRADLAARLARAGFHDVGVVSAGAIRRPGGGDPRAYPMFLAIAWKT